MDMTSVPDKGISKGYDEKTMALGLGLNHGGFFCLNSKKTPKLIGRHPSSTPEHQADKGRIPEDRWMMHELHMW